jgi:hypothetical protein
MKVLVAKEWKELLNQLRGAIREGYGVLNSVSMVNDLFRVVVVKGRDASYEKVFLQCLPCNCSGEGILEMLEEVAVEKNSVTVHVTEAVQPDTIITKPKVRKQRVKKGDIK